MGRSALTSTNVLYDDSTFSFNPCKLNVLSALMTRSEGVCPLPPYAKVLRETDHYIIPARSQRTQLLGSQNGMFLKKRTDEPGPDAEKVNKACSLSTNDEHNIVHEQSDPTSMTRTNRNGLWQKM